MMQVIALVKPFRARAVLDALEGLPIVGGTVREVRGYNRQKNRLHRYLGSEFNASFVPKVELTVFVQDDDLPAVLRAVVGAARTGAMGDGKILVCRLLDEHVSW